MKQDETLTLNTDHAAARMWYQRFGDTVKGTDLAKSVVALVSDESIEGLEGADLLSIPEKVDLLLRPTQQRIAQLESALKEAKDLVRVWHGEGAWDIYESHSPEMIRINRALTGTNEQEKNNA